MITTLCGGTVLNPTLSVTAPPGTQFYNATPKPCPVVFGNAFIEGSIISDIYATLIGGYSQPVSINLTGAWAPALWQAICCGKVKLHWILFDFVLHMATAKSTLSGIPEPYDPRRLNDGDPLVFNDYKPNLWDKNSLSFISHLPYVSPLHGIAHYYFGTDDGCPTSLTGKIPKVQYDVTRLLNTNLSINGDDIPAPAVDAEVISSYLTFNCVFYGAGSHAVQVNCGSGIFNIGDKIVFETPPPGHSLPSSIQAGVVYYVLFKITNPLVRFMISATPGGLPIAFTDNINTTGYNVSLVLTRNAGNNPAAVIFDLLTNDFYGLNLDATMSPNNVDINVASFQAVHDFFYPRFLITANVNSGQAIATVSLANASLFSAGQVFTIYGTTLSESCTIQGVDTGTGK